jgi:two-component system LytT family sensor kinase
MIPARSSIVIAYFAAWILFLSPPVFFVNSRAGNSDVFSILSSPYAWLFFITYGLIFYLNTWFLLPRFYLEKKYIIYAVSILMLLAAVWH